MALFLHMPRFFQHGSADVVTDIGQFLRFLNRSHYASLKYWRFPSGNDGAANAQTARRHMKAIGHFAENAEVYQSITVDHRRKTLQCCSLEWISVSGAPCAAGREAAAKTHRTITNAS
jgi:hypothetical protein